MSRQKILFLIVLILPFLAGFWIIEQAEKATSEKQNAEAEQELSELNARLLKTAAPHIHFQELLERVSRGLSWDSDVEPFLTQLPSSARLYLFDESGKRLVKEGFRNDLVVMSQRFLDGLQRVAGDPAFAMKKADKQAGDAFVGDAESLFVIGRNPDRLCDLTSLGVRRLGGWFRIHSRGRRGGRGGRGGHILALIETRGIPDMKLVRQAIERIQKLAGPPFQFGWLFMERPSLNGNGHGKRLSTRVLPLLSRPQLPRIFHEKGSIFAVGYLPSGFRLVAARPGIIVSKKFGDLRAFLVVAFFAVLMPTLWHSIFGLTVTLSVRGQLIGIFGLAGLASLGALIGVSQAYREARQEALIRENQRNALRIMEKIDGNFESAFSYLLREYRGYSRALEANPGSFASILRPLERYHSEGLIEHVSLVNGSGSPCFRIPAEFPGMGANSVSQNIGRLLDNLGIQILRKYNSAQPDQEQGNSNSMFSVLLDRPVDDLIKNRAVLQSVSMAGEEKSAFLDLAFDKEGKVLFSLMILHDPKALEARHLKTTQGVFRRHSPFKLLAFPRHENSGVPMLGDRRILDSMEVVHLKDLVGQTQSVACRLARLDHEEVLLSAMPGRNLRDYSLAMVTPFAPISDKAHAISRSFLALAVGSVTFTLLVSLLLANSLLKPIRELTTGIDHLTSLRLDHQVEISTGDELEEIGNGLNSILSDMQEIALARTVQEQLLPAEPVAVGSVRCRGWMRPASDVCGELYDYIELPGGRLALVLVDISGKGISSALVMAMCKMALRLHLDMDSTSPSAILNLLDQHLRLNVRRVTNVVVFLGIANPASRTLTFSGGGGCFPFLFPPGGNGELLSLGAVGLGSQQYPQLVDRTIRGLEPGTRLAVSTDGLAQVADRSGAVLGVGGLLLILERLRERALENLGTELFRAVDEFAGTRVRLTDQTLLALEFSQEPGSK